MERLTKQWGEQAAVPTKLDLGETLSMPQKEYENLMAIVQALNAYEKLNRTPAQITEDLAELDAYRAVGFTPAELALFRNGKEKKRCDLMNGHRETRYSSYGAACAAPKPLIKETCPFCGQEIKEGK